MDLTFCTLFDSNYIDKGITLYKSMERCMPEFKLYVFAFDEKCYEILRLEKYAHIIPVSLLEFETPELRKVKEERTRVEYCWTCSPWIIKHVLDHYNETICTYIDADMEFFSSPQCVFDEMRKRQCSTIIVPHRFKDEQAEKEAHDKQGSYCVEFNTFVKDKNGYEALNWWAERCLEWCFYAVPGTTEWYGDQKYLNDFPERFAGVMICEHYGVGLAPWNIKLVKLAAEENGVPIVKVLKSGEKFPVILYHFENVSFISQHVLHASSQTTSKDLHRIIYDSYIKRLIDNRKYIEDKYGFRLSRARRIVTKNSLMKLYQKYISPFRRVKHRYDLYWVE